VKGTIRATVKVAGYQREKRFVPGTPARVRTAWKIAMRAKLQKAHPQPERKSPTGSLGRDAETYYPQITYLVDWRARRSEIRAWIAELGTMPRHTITRADVLRVRGIWLENGVKPKTCNSRVSALRHLCHLLDGDDAATPCDGVKPLPVHKSPPRVITPADVNAVLARLETNAQQPCVRFDGAKTRARLMVLASTGKRPSEVMRAQPGDVDLRRRVWIARDGKGGFSPGVFLNDDMTAAWEAFIEADAWGTFNTGSFARTLRAAGWPADVRPYNLRHSIGIALSEMGADLADIQQHMGHRRMETTRRHYVPVLGTRMEAMSRELDGRFGWGPASRPASGSTKTSSVNPTHVLAEHALVSMDR
jgi:integrase